MDERKRGIGESVSGGQPSGESKRIKRDENSEGKPSSTARHGHEPSPLASDDHDDAASTDKQLRERNAALREALLEKNRRIQFLETKCGELFGHRHAIDARLQTVLNHWTILLKTLHTLLPNASTKDIDKDIKTSLGFIAPPTALPDGLQCEIDAWFLAGTEPAAPTPSSNDDVTSSLTSEIDLVKSWVATLLDKAATPEAARHAIEAKQKAERQVLAYQDRIQTYKLQVHELKTDLNKKELERHSACRRLDRANASAGSHPISSASASSSAKAAAATDSSSKPSAALNADAVAKWQQKVEKAELHAKEASDRLEKALTETRKAKASEHAVKQSIDALEKLHGETLDHLHEELAAVKDEYQKLKHKSKDIETHMHEKWEKKLTKVSTESAKLRAKLDEAAAKNAELRQRVTSYSAFKDQVAEWKALVASLETELGSTKDRLAATTEKLQKAAADRTGDTDTQVAALLEGHEVEINALVAEVEAVTKDADSLRAQLTKTMAKVTQRDTTIAKVNAALAKAEQTNALCFDELAGVRLQVSSLTTLQRNQKALETTLQDALKLKEDELATLRDHVKTIEKVKVDSEKERIKFAREVTLVKQTMNMQQQQQHPRDAADAKPCDQCLVYKRAEEERQEKLRVARAAGGEVSELERYELVEARKKLNCSVCQDAPKEVMISKCCHMFCKECMDSNLKARNRKCPTCKKMFGQDDVKGVYWA